MLPGTVAFLDLAGHDHAWLRQHAESVFAADEACVLLLSLDGCRVTTADDPSWLIAYPLPVVAVAEQDLTAGAFNLAIACDVRVVSESARLGPIDEAATDYGWDRLSTLLGQSAAVAVMNDGSWPAPAAFEAGLVSSCQPPGTALAEARRIADVIASRGPIAVRLAKEAIWRGLPLHLEHGLRFETDLTLLLQTTKDRAEGVAAFVQKRTPIFLGE
ncbi:MAG TPA: enoyl-CoA hydratase-related protein [Tepidiformaceae bacterium]|nr:enoyl-CoA hydratase-related protein [Tepidiformaceae bacterium]